MNLEEMASALVASGEYRIQKKFHGLPILALDELPVDFGIGVALDTETTGREDSDKIIELGMVSFAYDKTSGEVIGVLGTFNALEDPGMPISPEASAVNNITDEMVAGKSIDDAAVISFVEMADFVVAHNAGFDRRYCEARFPIFKNKIWACSWKQVDWAAFGSPSGKLEQIASSQGFYYDAHRAEMDCFALIQVLTHRDAEGNTALRQMLENSKRESVRIWAVNSPFASKDALKARGYRWSDGLKNNSEKAWFTEIFRDELDAELDFLKAEVFLNKPLALPVDVIDGFSRFSSRRLGTHRVCK